MWHFMRRILGMSAGGGIWSSAPEKQNPQTWAKWNESLGTQEESIAHSRGLNGNTKLNSDHLKLSITLLVQTPVSKSLKQTVRLKIFLKNTSIRSSIHTCVQISLEYKQTIYNRIYYFKRPIITCSTNKN